MSEKTTKSISAEEWLKIRDHVATEIRKSRPRMETSTSIATAEHLLRLGIIDLDTVHTQVTTAHTNQTNALAAEGEGEAR